MVPNLKLILDEIGHRFDNHDSKWDHHFNVLEHDPVDRNAIVDRFFVELNQSYAMTIPIDVEQHLTDLKSVLDDDEVGT
jgi:hypothetical protein